MIATAFLDFKQEDISTDGCCAIECRINAETREGLPSCGAVTLLHVPGGPNVRFDTALYQNYDTSILRLNDRQLVVCAKTREEAMQDERRPVRAGDRGWR